MPAPKQFQRDDVLRLAMHRFWTHGYAATGMRDLSAHMGVGASSLYREFGGKHDLFVQALDLYCDEVAVGHLAMLHDPAADLDTIRDYLRSTVAGLARGDWNQACLFINAAVERASCDPAVRERFSAYTRRMERALRSVLARAVDNGELPADTDVHALAQFFAGIAQGVVVLGKGTQDRERISNMVEVALRLLDRAPAP